MSDTRSNAAAKIDGLDGTVAFEHYKGDGEVIHVTIADANARKVGERQPGVGNE